MNSVSIEETAFPTFHDSQLQSLTPHQVRKLTAAAGYYRALLAVHFDENDQAMIWGMVSAGTDWVNRVDAASDRHDDLPENLIIHCLGPGHLIASAGYARVLESANGRILMEGFDPFRLTWLPKRFRSVRADLPRRTWSFVKRQNAFVRIK